MAGAGKGSPGPAAAPAQRVAVLGSANADLVIQVPRLPAKGETLAAASLEVVPGGKGANQAVAAARLAAPTSFVGRVGRDGNGRMMRDAFAAAGVDVAGLAEVRRARGPPPSTPPGTEACALPRLASSPRAFPATTDRPQEEALPTGCATVFLLPDGDNSIVIVGGANQSPGWALTEGTKEIIAGAAYLLLQREVPEHVNVEAAQYARAHGTQVILDAGGSLEPLSPELLASVDLFSPNETELANLTGAARLEATAEIVAAARRLRAEHGVGDVLVKLGARGSLLVGGDRVWHQPAFEVAKVVDTTAAGDCFTAAVAVGMGRGEGLEAAIRFASAAAAVSVQKKGAIPSLPGVAEAEAVLAQAANPGAAVADT